MKLRSELQNVLCKKKEAISHDLDYRATSRKLTIFFLSSLLRVRWCCCYLQYAVVAFNTVTTNADQVLADDQEGMYIPGGPPKSTPL